MAGPGTRKFAVETGLADVRHHVMIIEAPYYEDVSHELAAGAIAVLDQHGATYDRVTVPGALEIPQVLAQAVQADAIPMSAPRGKYSGVIALGCVIRGETSHYDIVVNNANHWLMQLGIQHGIAIGNGVLTVDTHTQAMARAGGGAAGKGGDAARACLQVTLLGAGFAAGSAQAPSQ
ncbi:MAG TPA: 6,7-dimethyl-8-ribityllumazine synthase [Hyphomicrobiaceae bacterium]|nr:6,7-dimethyl-8-ribityllumazine synthase [Hyphomicrobiaceae bacterium]